MPVLFTVTTNIEPYLPLPVDLIAGDAAVVNTCKHGRCPGFHEIQGLFDSTAKLYTRKCSVLV